jgi:transcriptional regulator with XRE-family HTH domain
MANVHDDPGIGRRVSAARRRLGWSREALAFHAGISWSAIRQLEAGRRRNLRPGTLAGLARALGVTVGYLVSGDVVSVEMLEHRVLVYETDAEFMRAAVRFLSEAVERSEAALAVTTSAHCDELRDRLGDETSGVEFADQSSWCDTPGGAMSRTRAFVRGHLEAGVPWIRILVEPQLTGRSNVEIRLWAKYESLFNLVFQTAPLTTLCAYDAALDAEVLEQMRSTHPDTHSATGETTPNGAYLDPTEFVLTPDVDTARPAA